MGTNGPQSPHASRRGLASFVSFLLLFAFALGQSGSLMALAGGDSRGSALPAPQAPAPDGIASTSSGGATPVTRSAPAAGKLKTASATRDDAVAAPAAPPGGGSLDGGDIDLDFIAAGPFTYSHATGLGPNPPFGYNNRTISKSTGVVESLESGDFACDDLVTFFTEITVDAGAASGGTIELDYTYGAETTGQPGLGFSDIISVAVNTPDSGNKNLDGDEVATLIAEGLDSSGYDQVTGTVQVEGLDPGDVVIVRSIVLLTCLQGQTPTGNILSAIETGRVTSPENDTIQVGQQTVPMKTTGFVAEPAIDIEKTCPAEAAFGDDITYDITITNNGNEDLENIVVTDTVNGNAPVNISNLFDDTLAAGASDSAQYVYSPDANDPDPLPNTVTVTADGLFSSTEVTDTDTCDTDITHVPGIDVTKSCPQTVAFGADITYTITVTNTGNEALEDVTVNDTLLGDITGDFDFDFSGPFPVGELATATVSYSPGADEDPVDNTVTATGNGVDSGVEASDEASCRTDITHAPGIDVTKSCPQTVAFGADITYTITVTNTGNEALENVLVSDALLGGDITAAFNLADPFPVGGTASAEFTYTPGADEDPVANSVTASGDGVDSGTPVTDTAVCSTDVSNPGISILKTVDEEIVPIGTTVTFTYVVTNTGDVTLFNISVDDDILGHIGDIASLDPGEDATLTKDFVVGDEPVTNIGTAVGHDILGREVSASDDATVAPIAGENPSPPNPPTTPFTGSDAGRLGLITMVLFGIGVTVVASTRRRRTKGEAA